MNKELKLGKYEHYKGKQYEVVGVARHSETLEELVVYRALYDSKIQKNLVKMLYGLGYCKCFWKK